MNKKSRPIGLNLSLEKPGKNERLKTLPEVSSSQRNQMPQITRMETSPGPGSYYLGTIFNKKKGITIAGLKSRQEKAQKKPDPWSYVPDNSFTKARSPRATIGRERKFQRLKNMPGPADYNSNYRLLLERSRNTFIGTSRKQQVIENKPAPTDYDTLKVDKTLRRNISIVIGKSQRPDIAKKDSPGPGEYKLDDEFSIKVKNRSGFTMGSRVRSQSSSEAPDNFFKYNASKMAVLPQSPAYSIKKQQPKDSQNSISPGPAAYSPTHKNKQGITIPKSQRTLYKNETSNLAKYNIAIPEAGPAFSIPKARRENEGRGLRPGPADYRPQMPRSQKYRSIGIGMGDKYSFQHKEVSPGPGNYNVGINPSSLGFTVGHEQRKMYEQNVAPGPADYFINYWQMQKYVSEKKK